MRRDTQRLVDAVAKRVELKLLQERRDTPCTASAEQCEGDGLCAVRRPGDMERMRSAGAVRLGASPGVGPVRADLAGYIDHTLLKAEATKEQLAELCEEARTYTFASVCVNSSNVRFCKMRLRGTPVMTIAVVGFPLGVGTTSSKAFETREAIRDGADEIDMVINVGALKSRDYKLVTEDIAGVVDAAKPIPVKVILETGSLTDEEKVIACVLSKAAGAAFVKTSTGFGKGGATEADVALMRRVVGAEMGVKASGGMRDADTVDRMVKAGATRIGASASVAIVQGKTSKSSY